MRSGPATGPWSHRRAGRRSGPSRSAPQSATPNAPSAAPARSSVPRCAPCENCPAAPHGRGPGVAPRGRRSPPATMSAAADQQPWPGGIRDAPGSRRGDTPRCDRTTRRTPGPRFRRRPGERRTRSPSLGSRPSLAGIDHADCRTSAAARNPAPSLHVCRPATRGPHPTESRTRPGHRRRSPASP